VEVPIALAKLIGDIATGQVLVAWTMESTKRLSEMTSLTVVRAEFHSEWNYTIRPSNRLNREVDS
jgi:hypothetical protein